MTKERQSMDSKRVSEVPFNRRISCLSNLKTTRYWVRAEMPLADVLPHRTVRFWRLLACHHEDSDKEVGLLPHLVIARVRGHVQPPGRVAKRVVDEMRHEALSNHWTRMRGRRSNRGEQAPQQRTHILWLHLVAPDGGAQERTQPQNVVLIQRGTRGTSSPTRRCCSRVGDTGGDRLRSDELRAHVACHQPPVHEDPKQTANVNLNIPEVTDGKCVLFGPSQKLGRSTSG